jgi:hypothetical protein
MSEGTLVIWPLTKNYEMSEIRKQKNTSEKHF